MRKTSLTVGGDGVPLAECIELIAFRAFAKRRLANCARDRSQGQNLVQTFENKSNSRLTDSIGQQIA
jgi:hypothetical protein